MKYLICGLNDFRGDVNFLSFGMCFDKNVFNLM